MNYGGAGIQLLYRKKCELKNIVKNVLETWLVKNWIIITGILIKTIMNIDKDDLYIYGLISGLIICSPFLGVYYGAKWIYNHTPQKAKEKK